MMHDLLLIALGLYAGVFLYDAFNGFKLTRWAQRLEDGWPDEPRSIERVDDETVNDELERLARL